jgi:hypothetical protein
MRGPTPQAEGHSALQSTIRVPVPELPSTYVEKPPLHLPEMKLVTHSTFRWALGVRGLIAIACTVPFLLLPPRSAFHWWTLYPLLGGVVTTIGGVRVYSDYKAGRFLIVDGVVAVAFGVFMLMLLGKEHSNIASPDNMWAILTGALQIAAAIELRRHVSHTLLLGLAGATSVVYALVFYVFITLSMVPSSYVALFPHVQLGTVVAFGVLIVGFGFLTRPRSSSVGLQNK